MNDIQIVEYENEMKASVRSLFLRIYPGNTMLAEKVNYDKELPDHMTTKIAFQDGSIIGQANIFKKAELNGNANLGFLVCPQHRMRGIAKRLCNAAIEDAKKKGVDRIYIITAKNNNAAIAVAKSIGFCIDTSKNADEGVVVFSKTL